MDLATVKTELNKLQGAIQMNNQLAQSEWDKFEEKRKEITPELVDRINKQYGIDLSFILDEGLNFNMSAEDFDKFSASREQVVKRVLELSEEVLKSN